MSDFLDYLASHPWRQPGRRISEPIILLYKFIEDAFRTECDTLAITPDEIVWRRAEQSVRHFPIHGMQPDLGWRDYLEVILQEDTVLQSHVQVAHETSETVVYRLLR
jgi:hypothetical protein